MSAKKKEAKAKVTKSEFSKKTVGKSVKKQSPLIRKEKILTAEGFLRKGEK